MSKQGKSVEVQCAGCGLVQRTRQKGWDGFLCGYPGCKRNPSYVLPELADGEYMEIGLNVAGGFTGFRVQKGPNPLLTDDGTPNWELIEADLLLEAMRNGEDGETVRQTMENFRQEYRETGRLRWIE